VYKTSLSRHRAAAPPHLVPQAACPSTLVIPSASAYPDHHVLRLAHFLIRGCLKPSLVASLGFTRLLKPASRVERVAISEYINFDWL
jgi:hypothetical protein